MTNENTEITEPKMAGFPTNGVGTHNSRKPAATKAEKQILPVRQAGLTRREGAAVGLA